MAKASIHSTMHGTRAVFGSSRCSIYLDTNNSYPLVNRATLKATVILLPVLGLTWVFGVLTIDRNTTVFAWLFTIFNSIQVCVQCYKTLYTANAKSCLKLLCSSLTDGGFVHQSF